MIPDSSAETGRTIDCHFVELMQDLGSFPDLGPGKVVCKPFIISALGAGPPLRPEQRLEGQLHLNNQGGVRSQYRSSPFKENKGDPSMDQQETHAVETLATEGFVYGVSPTIQTVNEMAAEIAATDIPVLILGESGSGKDAYARFIHRLSAKRELRLQKIDCATLEPGELTHQMRQSSQNPLPEEACRTIYFDNVQELGVESQRALLSLLPDEQNSDRIGECFRVISSTSRSLESEVEEDAFAGNCTSG